MTKLPDDDTAAFDRVAARPRDARTSLILSDALMKLSFRDRTRIEEEIHGVGCRAVNETPGLVQTAQQRLDQQLNERKEREPHNRVLRNIVRIYSNDGDNVSPKGNGCYVNDPDVRIRFLRKEYFVVEKAVNAFVGFLEIMGDLFGDFVADRPVTRSDFSPKEKKALKKSRAQWLPFRDRSGRRVFVQLGSANFHLEVNTTLKILMYQQWAVSSDVDAQKQGVVFHAYTFDDMDEAHNWERDLRTRFTKQDSDNCAKAVRCFPVRMAASHMYFADTAFSRLMSVLHAVALDQETRTITKFHFGELTEHLYKMATLGVPVDVVPITPSGSIKFTNHCAWLDTIEKMEQGGAANDDVVVDCPLVNDVVFRQGATSRYNPGNEYYREVIQSHAPEHFFGDNKEKYRVTNRVYDAIVNEKHGRFLEWSTQEKLWKVVRDPELARKKIAKTYKDFKYRGVKAAAKREAPSATAPHTVADAIRSAAAVVVSDAENDAAVQVPEPAPLSSSSALRDYYTMAHHPSKRLKTSGCACFGSSGDHDEEGGNDACFFGKNFFPVDNSSTVAVQS